VGGAAVTTLSANAPSQGHNTALGVSLCLGSALLYGVYTVLIGQVTPSDEGVFNIRVMFGFVGLFNLVLLAPVIGILHATGTEDLSGLSWNILGLIVIKGLFDNVLSDILWAMAILLTSPTAATIGLSLTVPLAIASDWLLQ
jgi:solute carrier family 35 protein F5